MFASPISRILVVVLVLGVAVLTVSFANHAPAADHSYDAVELLRSQAHTTMDTSYDAIEQIRVQRMLADALPDTDYALVEALRVHSSFIMPKP